MIDTCEGVVLGVMATKNRRKPKLEMDFIPDDGVTYLKGTVIFLNQ